VLTGTYHYLLGPVAGFVVVAVLLGLSRWTFGTGRTRSRRPAQTGPRDYGLLVPVATVSTPEDAEMLQRLLAAHGIRATVATPADYTAASQLHRATHATGEPADSPHHVLVFRDQALAARNLLLPR
jgi:MarR-like DNA-binding transcriptional regulator SgrR of sgrS sRNA